jgi:hypothetical protein
MRCSVGDAEAIMTATRWLTVLLCVLSLGSARASDKLKLERIDLTRYPAMKLYLTAVDGEGRTIGGRVREDFNLLIDGMEQNGGASSALPFNQPLATANDAQPAREPINVLVLVQLSSQMEDALDEIKKGVRAIVDAAGPRGKVGLFGYAGEIRRVQELGAPADVEAALANLQTEEGAERHLVEAVRRATDALGQAAPVKLDPKTRVEIGERNLLVVISDGLDFNMDALQFQSAGKHAQEAGVVIDTVAYGSFEGARGARLLGELSARSNGTGRTARATGELAAQLTAVADEIAKQYVVTFESPIAGGTAKEHSVQAVLTHGGRRLFSAPVVTRFPPNAHPRRDWSWWLWALLVAGGVALVGVAALIVRARSAGEAAPVWTPPVPVPPPPGPPPRTVLIGVPVFGWIVATNGKHAEQTFKLKPSVTVIGTGDDCDIVVDDQFMSKRHCEVHSANGSYKMIDLGSTNGIVVNDQKVREHELIDNDRIRLGKTEFKFKSI